MQIPPVGTQVQVVVENLSRRHAWDPETVTFEGQVAPRLRGMDADYFGLTTGDPHFPVRSIRAARVTQITVGGTTVKQTMTTTPDLVLRGTWQVPGSKGNIYTVTRNGGQWACDCIAGGFNRVCKHVKQIQAQEGK